MQLFVNLYYVSAVYMLIIIRGTFVEPMQHNKYFLLAKLTRIAYVTHVFVYLLLEMEFNCRILENTLKYGVLSKILHFILSVASKTKTIGTNSI